MAGGVVCWRRSDVPCAEVGRAPLSAPVLSDRGSVLCLGRLDQAEQVQHGAADQVEGGDEAGRHPRSWQVETSTPVGSLRWLPTPLVESLHTQR